MTQSILEVKNLTKQFGPPAGGFRAVNDVSFSVAEGEIVGLLGPNGAGKTTTIQMLLGLMTPTAGSVIYFGQDLRTHREQILQRINHASGYSRLPWRLSIWENLHVYARLYQVAHPKAKIMELVEAFDAEKLLPKKFQDLSAGQMTRTLLIKAFLNDPELVLLDEPTASLDPDIASKIREYILAERRKRNLSILITSHNMREVEEMCDRVIFLNHGTIYAVDTPQGLAKRNQQSELNLMIDDGLKRLIELVTTHKLVYKETNRFITITIPESLIAGFLTEIGQRGIVFSEIEIVRPSLEDFFLSVSREQI
jgi:ABC-2 type transport system ATP-binding protein